MHHRTQLRRGFTLIEVMTVESDGGSIYPVVYVRRDGKTEEHPLEPDPLHDFEGLAYRRDLGKILDRLTAGASAA